ncbi:branched-chain amino acid ABC transporter permease [Effusibacillus consociatus]|uniref:Branched-chain amino acid ABC transporter permease n=1 Tax=Effusibacillus consociatus TaxID=1117041 RepID=A0ABV9Q5K9_9BACL
MDTMLIFAGINIILALSLYITLSTGQISLGHGAFMAIGAYVAGIFTTKMVYPLIPALVIGGAAAAVLGLLVGFPALRVRGIYLAIGTLGLGEVLQVVLQNVEYIGAASGMGGMQGTTFPLVWATVALCLLFCHRLNKSRLGQAFKAVQQDEVASLSMGIHNTYMKLLAFTISAGMAGIGGGLYAHYIFFIDPHAFGFHTSLLILFYVIFGGVETFWGAALGALILTLLPEVIRPLEEWRMVVYGLLIIVMMMIRPQGLLSASTVAKIASVFSESAAPKKVALGELRGGNTHVND